ncbi:MAG: dephospho-CoA kinase [Woeseiaceae bacterium]
MSEPLRIGLTGGIASGKSTVADMFADLGITVVDTDVIAREVVEPGQPALDEIRQAFGDAVFNPDGTLDRNAMRRLIFADDEARQRLESIVHPRIGQETLRQADAARGDYIIIVVPLLVNSALRHQVDRVLVVDCDEATQIERLLARDAESEEQAKRILAAQSSRAERLEIADDVIENNATLDEVAAAVSAFNDRYIALANLPAS